MKTNIIALNHTHLLPHILILVWALLGLTATAQSWTNRYNGPGNSGDWGRAIAVGSSGSVYVTGRSTGSGTEYDCTTIAYTSAGVPLWTRRYNGPGNDKDWGQAIAVDPSGNVYVTGAVYQGPGFEESDYLTIKYSSAGVPLWTKFYNGPGNNHDEVKAIAVDGSGNVYVTGESANASPYYDCLDTADPSRW